MRSCFFCDLVYVPMILYDLCRNDLNGWTTLETNFVNCFRDYSSLFLGPNFGPISNAKMTNI